MTATNPPAKPFAGALDTRRLDRAIATQLGWHGFFTRTDWYEDPDCGSYEVERLMGFDTDNSERAVPNWEGDTDTALTLIDALPDNCEFKLIRAYKSWETEIRTWHPFEEEWYDKENTAARAICGVWHDFMRFSKTMQPAATAHDAGSRGGEGDSRG